MKPDFALKLSHAAIELLARGPDGWTPIGEVLLSDPGLDAGLARLRDLAATTAGGPFHTKLILPEAEVLFEDVPAPGPTDAERAEQVRTALQGLTAYDLDQLAYDWEPAADGRAHVVLAARFILDEAEGFAHAHQFNPVSIVAPTAGPFTREPFLGVTEVAHDLLEPGTEVEPEAEPMRLLPARAPLAAPVPPGTTADAEIAAVQEEVPDDAAAGTGDATADGIRAVAEDNATASPNGGAPAASPSPTEIVAPKSGGDEPPSAQSEDRDATTAHVDGAAPAGLPRAAQAEDAVTPPDEVPAKKADVPTVQAEDVPAAPGPVESNDAKTLSAEARSAAPSAVIPSDPAGTPAGLAKGTARDATAPSDIAPPESDEAAGPGPKRLERTPGGADQPAALPQDLTAVSVPRATPLPEKLAAALENAPSPALAAPRKGAAMPAKLVAATLAAKAGAGRKTTAAPLRADPRTSPPLAGGTPEPAASGAPSAPETQPAGGLAARLGGFVARTRGTTPPAQGLAAPEGPKIDTAETERVKQVFDRAAAQSEVAAPRPAPEGAIAPVVFASRRGSAAADPVPPVRIAPAAAPAPETTRAPAPRAVPEPTPVAAPTAGPDPQPVPKPAPAPAGNRAGPASLDAGPSTAPAQGLTRGFGNLGARLGALPVAVRALVSKGKNARSSVDPAAMAEVIAAPVRRPEAKPKSKTTAKPAKAGKPAAAPEGANGNPDGKAGLGRALPWKSPASATQATDPAATAVDEAAAAPAPTARADTSRQAPTRPRQPLAAEGNVSEAEALTIFGARRAATPATAGRSVGLILTGALVLVLAAVALWSVFYLRDDRATLSQADAPAAQTGGGAITTPEALAPVAPGTEGFGALQPAPDPAQVGPFNIDEPIDDLPQGTAGPALPLAPDLQAPLLALPDLGTPAPEQVGLPQPDDAQTQAALAPLEVEPSPAAAAPEAAPLPSDGPAEAGLESAVEAAVADALGAPAESVAPEAAEPEPVAELAAEDATPDPLAEDAATAAAAGELVAAEEAAPAPDMSPEALAAAYPDTGIWPFAPDPATAPVSRRIDDLQTARTDPDEVGTAFPALPEASAALRDPIPRAPAAPPAFEDLAALLPGVPVAATPEGSASAEGVVVIAGAPPVVPPSRADALPPVPVVGAAVPNIPADARPAPRPANLVPPAAASAPDPETPSADEQGALTAPDAPAAADRDAVRQATTEPEAAAQAVAAFTLPRPEVAAAPDADAADRVVDALSVTAGRAAGPGGIALAALTPQPRPTPEGEAPDAAAPATALAAAVPLPRPAGLAAAAAAAAPAAPAPDAFANATEQAVARSILPSRRPAGFAELAAQRRAAAAAATAAAAAAAPAPTQVAAAAAPASAAPAIPTRASVAQEATEARAINLRNVNLIGVFGTSSNRRALVRLSGGSIVTVRVGDRLDGGQVAAIGDGELRYVKNGRNEVLRVGG